MDKTSEEVMRQMAKMAVEQATEMFAEMAETFASNPLMSKASGAQALKAFAAAIRSSNKKQFPREDARS